MTDAAPKKKKAAAKKPAPEAASPSDADVLAAVLDAALKDAAFDGFTEAVLQKAGKTAGADAARLALLFPNGPLSLVEAWSHSVDAQMEVLLAQMDLAAMKIRGRISAAVLARLSILKPHKEAARRAAAMLTLPAHAALGAKLIYRSVDAMWRAVGDTATDFNFYSKRAILAGVYGATLMRWFNDTEEAQEATSAFLAARMENVMQIEKFKAGARTALANFPAFANWVKSKS